MRNRTPVSLSYFIAALVIILSALIIVVMGPLTGHGSKNIAIAGYLVGLTSLIAITGLISGSKQRFIQLKARKQNKAAVLGNFLLFTFTLVLTIFILI